MKVDPLKGLFFGFQIHLAVLDNLAHLCIEEGVPDDHLLLLHLLLEALCLEREVVEVEREWSKASVAKPLLELLQLLDESAPDLEIWSPRVKELERFKHRPAVLAHEVGSQDGRRSALASDGVDKHRLVLLDRVLDEVEYGLCGGIFSVENNLILEVHPLEGEVNDAPAFEVIRDLLARAVDDVGDFVRHYKLLVLQENE